MVVYLSKYVVDTSLLIDLYFGEIAYEFFQLPYNFIAPDVIIAELQEPDSRLFIELGLQEHELTGSQILEVMELRSVYRHPSVNDLFALVLARLLSLPLLTSDGNLRKAAVQEGVQVHGTLWALDEMVRLQIISQVQAAGSLKLMCEKGSRLPQDECDKRLREWLETF